MNVRPIAQPGQSASTPIASPTAGANAAKARAVAAFNSAGQSSAPTQGQQQEHPVQNASNVSVEELGAIQASTATEPVEAQAEPVETPKEQPKEETKESRQWAQLARQERALRAKAQQQDQALKAREAALAAREAELNAKAAPPVPQQRQWTREEAKADPVGFAADHGLSYEEFTQAIINQQPSNPKYDAHIAKLEAKIRQLEEITEKSQQTYQEQQKSAYQAAVKQIEMDAKALVKSDPEAYEAITKTGTIRQVVKLIEDTYNKDGVLMTVEEAAQEVENYLVEENYNMATKIEKIKRRMQQNAQPAKSEAKTQSQQQTQMKTLTNAASSTRRLSARERAMLAFKNELK